MTKKFIQTFAFLGLGVVLLVSGAEASLSSCESVSRDCVQKAGRCDRGGSPKSCTDLLRNKGAREELCRPYGDQMGICEDAWQNNDPASTICFKTCKALEAAGKCDPKAGPCKDFGHSTGGTVPRKF